MVNENEIIIFETKDKSISLPVRIENESVWLNRNQMAELFERDVKTIGKHINNALKEELSEQNSVVAKFATTASDNKTYMVEHYNLDVIISVGYRVKSKRGEMCIRDRENIIMPDGQRITISKSGVTEFKSILLRFWEKLI